eukprot:10940969-Heterocapsa_arctica.AAC.1
MGEAIKMYEHFFQDQHSGPSSPPDDLADCDASSNNHSHMLPFLLQLPVHQLGTLDHNSPHEVS